VNRAAAAAQAALAAAARASDRARFLFLPAALCALAAVGAHAAADVLADRVFFAVDLASAALDGLFSRWDLTRPLVDLVGVEQRSFFARSIALVLELCADALLAAPLLGYQERPGEMSRALEQLRKWRSRPGTLRISRPIFTAGVAVAGASAVARLAHGSIFAGLRHLAGAGAAEAVARFGGLLALLSLLGLIAWRAVLRSLEESSARADRQTRSKRRALTVGLAGSLALSPIAFTAVAHAARLGSFFR
jgi:hypothetical protein